MWRPASPASAARQFFPRFVEQPCEVWSGSLQVILKYEIRIDLVHAFRMYLESRHPDALEQVLGKRDSQYLPNPVILWIMQTGVDPVFRDPLRKPEKDDLFLVHGAISGIIRIVSLGISQSGFQQCRQYSADEICFRRVAGRV